MIRFLETITDKESYVSKRNAQFITEALGKKNVRFHKLQNSDVLSELNIDNDDILIAETRDGIVRHAISMYGCRNTVESDRTIVLTQNKEYVKSELQRHGILSPRKITIEEVKEGYTYFVKPMFGEDSNFVDIDSVCQSKEEVRRKADVIQKAGFTPMIEEFIGGEEYTVALLMKEGKKEAYPIKVNLFTPWNIMTQAAKFSENEICEAVYNTRLEDIAKKAFDIVGCKHYMRIDFRRDSQGRYYLIDFNLFPGLGPTDHFAKCMNLHLNISYHDVLTKIIETATK
jgi:hypothetical protein